VLVSVIIPNYNHAKYLNQRINSILNQTYQNFELIILDDFSIDGSKVEIEKYRTNSKVSHIVYNTVNSGSPFIQWEKGISLARGEYIWIAESDDFSSIYFLEDAVSKLANDSSLFISFCRSAHIDDQGNFISLNTWGEEIHSDIWVNSFKMNGIEVIEKMLLFRNVIPNASAVVFRNDVAKEVSLLKKGNWIFSGDWYFWYQLLKKGDLYYNSTVLNFQRSNNSTTRGIKSFDHEKKRYQEVYRVILDISECLDIFPNFKDGRYFWIHNTYIERVSIRAKFTYHYWILDAPYLALLILLRNNFNFYINRLSLKRLRAILSIFKHRILHANIKFLRKKTI